MPDVVGCEGIERRGLVEKPKGVPDRQGLAAQDEIVQDRRQFFRLQNESPHLLFSGSEVGAQDPYLWSGRAVPLSRP